MSELLVSITGDGFAFTSHLTSDQFANLADDFSRSDDDAAEIDSFKVASYLVATKTGLVLRDERRDEYYLSDAMQINSFIGTVRTFGVTVSGSLEYFHTQADGGTLACDGRLYVRLLDSLPPAHGGKVASGDADAVRALLDRLPAGEALRGELESALGFIDVPSKPMPSLFA